MAAVKSANESHRRRLAEAKSKDIIRVVNRHTMQMCEAAEALYSDLTRKEMDATGPNALREATPAATGRPAGN